MSRKKTTIDSSTTLPAAGIAQSPWWLVAALAGFAAIAYGPQLSLPFIGDDYVFIDRTLHASFSQLWSRANTDFGWYRPWSRDLHFWVLEHLFGLSPLAFRIAGLGLWLADLLLFVAFLRLLVPAGPAQLAGLGAGTLALWGSPILWISGSQDLWMVCFALMTLLLWARERRGLAAAALALALLSKETAAVLPFLVVGFEVIVRRTPVGVAVRRTAGLWMVLIAWAVFHPTLMTRLLPHEYVKTAEIEQRPGPFLLAVRTFMSIVSLDLIPRPAEVLVTDVIAAVASALLIGCAVWFLPRPASAGEMRRDRRAALTGFGLLWVAAGWLPLLVPTIGWHAYYGCLGALGAWFLMALWLPLRREALAAALVALSLLRAAHAKTPSWDWGNEWYLRRAGSFLAAIHSELGVLHPELPPHSRLYFARIPNNVGFIAGSSPAVRVWYRDTTLRAGFYSYYRPRLASEAEGTDYFFRFDTVRVLVEVHAGDEDVALARAENPEWSHDHEVLAALFIERGNVRGAAAEYAKLATASPERADYALWAGAANQAIGDRARAEGFYRVARSAWGDSLVRVEATALVQALPLVAAR